MTKLKFTFLLLLFYNLIVDAQVAFQKTYGGTVDEFIKESIETTDGGYISIGQTNSFGAGGWDIYLLKTNMNGDIVWAKTYGGTDGEFGSSVRQTQDGGYILTGNTQSFGVSVGFNDVFLIKTDMNGNILWSKTYGGIYSDLANSIEITSDGGFVIAGTARSFGTSDDVYIIKTNSLGNLMWTKTFGSGFLEIGYCCKQTSDGGFIIMGQTDGLGLAGQTDIYLIKIDSNGNKLWSNYIGASKSEYGYSIEETIDGGFIIAGSTNSFYPGGLYAFLAKIDSNGNISWSKIYGTGNVNGGEYCYSVKQTLDKGYIITGETNGFNTNNVSVFLIKIDSIGSIVWTKIYSSNNGHAFGRSIGQNSKGDYIIASTIVESGNHNFYFIKAERNGNSGCNQINVNAKDSIVIFIQGTVSEVMSSGGIIGNPSFITTNALTTVSNELCNYNGKVWPGDVDNNYTVDNSDILPIGLFYGENGNLRDSISNLWQADSSLNWGKTQTSGFDIKHADCNGDGMIDVNDTLAINLNFSMVHTIIPHSSELRSGLPSIYFVTSSNTYFPGDIINVEVWVGDSTIQADSLYGIAFNVKYNDPDLIQTGTEVFSFPPSWLGVTPVNSINISRISSLDSTIYAAKTRTNHINARGFGKIANFKFQAKTTISVPSTLNFSISGYSANDSSSVSKYYNLYPHSIMINPFGTGVSEVDMEEISIFPNPYLNSTQISYTLSNKSLVSLEIFNSLGQKIESIVNSEQISGTYKYNFSAKQKGFYSGVYFVKIIINGKAIVKKIVEI